MLPWPCGGPALLGSDLGQRAALPGLRLSQSHRYRSWVPNVQLQQTFDFVVKTQDPLKIDRHNRGLRQVRYNVGPSSPSLSTRLPRRTDRTRHLLQPWFILPPPALDAAEKTFPVPGKAAEGCLPYPEKCPNPRGILRPPTTTTVSCSLWSSCRAGQNRYSPAADGAVDWLSGTLGTATPLRVGVCEHGRGRWGVRAVLSRTTGR